MSEENLAEAMVKSIEEEIERLKKLAEEKDKLLAKAKVVIYSSLMIAKADGEISSAESDKIQNSIFKRYHITSELGFTYMFSPEVEVDLPLIKEIVDTNELDKEFLEDLYTHLLKELPDADGEVSESEEEIMTKLIEVFNLSSEDE